MSLKHLQQRFSELALSEDAPPTGLIRGGKFSASRRLEVYQNAILQRLQEAVEQDFPLLKENLGEDTMLEWVADFLRKNPSTFPNINEVSSAFPNYVAGRQSIGFHSELARFEWYKVISALAPETPGVPEDIARLTEEILSEAQLVLEPSLILFQSDWNVPYGPEKKKSCLALQKVDGVVTVRPLESASYAILTAIVTGASMESLLAQMTGLNAAAVTKEFSQLVQHGMIVGFNRRKLENNR